VSKAERSKQAKPPKGGRGRESAAKPPKPSKPSKPTKPSKPVKATPSSDPAPGQRLYDMPYSSVAPQLANAELGLGRLVARSGSRAEYDIDLTLLDAHDHRLLRSGVLLAHRVLDGRGEWYLAAPDWEPLLPAEHIESMSQADLSEELSDLIRPFRRRAPLAPVAALRCERREFALRADSGATVALVRDDKVTIRRGGLTTARYREVMVTPVGSGLDQPQVDWLDACLISVGATVLPEFPRLVGRLGSPATGLTDFPEVEPFDPSAPFNTFVSSLIALRLRQLLTADLRLRSGDAAAATDLITAAARLHRELDGLRGVLDDAWVGDLLDELDWLGSELELDSDGPGRLTTRLRGERYLSLLDQLVIAARGGRVGDIPAEPAEAVLTGLVNAAVARLQGATERLAVDGPAHAWEQAYTELRGWSTVDDVVEHLFPAETARRRRGIERCLPLLEQVHHFNVSADQILQGVDDLTPAEAFALGREFERTREASYAARAEFLVTWAKVRRKLSS
jgi:hypothetical protein